MAEDRTREALQHGSRQAEKVLQFRDEALARRRSVATNVGTTKRFQDATLHQLESKFTRAAEAPSHGVLLAEGDSWFDYPWTDVLRVLEDDYAFDVYSVAHRGDRVEEMAYTGGQLEELTRLLEKLLRQGKTPLAILLSGGGNDVAGSEFGMLLNHSDAPFSGLNNGVVDGIINDRIRYAFVTILQAITHISVEKTGNLIPIVLHGYDYPVPDGRGFLGGWWMLPGPWLEPGFRQKGYETIEQRTRIAADLIDRFNQMVSSIPTITEFSHVKYVDLRGTLSNKMQDYTLWWSNELHPTANGFARVAGRFTSVL
jgi:hypothetical protein